MESASLLSSEEQTRAEIGQECCDGAGAGCCAVDDAGASSVTDTKEGAGERANEAVGTAAASGVSSSCQSGACNTACRARAAHHRKKLAELREQRKWHRGDFNNLYNSTLKDHRHADAGADVEPGHADAGAVIPAIVWSCLPGITMFAPFIGHVGVLRSDGALLDFAMSYAINLDRPAFGKPIRLLSLEPYMRIGGGGGGGDCVSHGSFEFERKGDQGDGEAERYVCSWDKILSEAVREYQNEQYSFFSNNCHTFVAHCLNKAKIPGPSTYATEITTAYRTILCIHNLSAPTRTPFQTSN